MRLIDADKLIEICDKGWRLGSAINTKIYHTVDASDIRSQTTVKAIPIEQLLSILPEYDDYIHTKTYHYNETMEDIYSKGYEDGWNACLKHIKEELDYWEKENEID